MSTRMDDDDHNDDYAAHRWQPSPDDLAWINDQAREYAERKREEESSNVVPIESEAAIIERTFPRIDWSELFATEDEGERWIIEPVLAEGRSTALYSKPKAGKSLLVLELAVNVSRGFAALGVKPPRPYRVLYVDFENDPRGDVRSRLEDMGYGQEEADAGALDNLYYLSFPRLSALDTAQGGGELLAIVEQYECEVVIIDTVSRTVAGEENDNNTWLGFYRNTGVHLKARGVAYLRLDHSGKDAEKGMRGGSAKYGDVDMVWRLTAQSETVIELECTDHRMRVENDRLTLVRESDPELYHRVAAGHEKAGLTAVEKRIEADIKSFGFTFDVTASEVYKAMKTAGKGGRKQLVMRVWRHMKDAARVAEQASQPVDNSPKPVDKPVPDPPVPGSPGTTPSGTARNHANSQVTGSQPVPGTAGNRVVPTPFRGGNHSTREPEPCPSGASAEAHRAGACDCWRAEP